MVASSSDFLSTLETPYRFFDLMDHLESPSYTLDTLLAELGLDELNEEKCQWLLKKAKRNLKEYAFAYPGEYTLLSLQNLLVQALEQLLHLFKTNCATPSDIHVALIKIVVLFREIEHEKSHGKRKKDHYALLDQQKELATLDKIIEQRNQNNEDSRKENKTHALTMLHHQARKQSELEALIEAAIQAELVRQLESKPIKRRIKLEVEKRIQGLIEQNRRRVHKLKLTPSKRLQIVFDVEQRIKFDLAQQLRNNMDVHLKAKARSELGGEREFFSPLFNLFRLGLAMMGATHRNTPTMRPEPAPRRHLPSPFKYLR